MNCFHRSASANRQPQHVLDVLGADFLAVAGGVWSYKDGPEAAVRGFNEIFSANA